MIYNKGGDFRKPASATNPKTTLCTPICTVHIINIIMKQLGIVLCPYIILGQLNEKAMTKLSWLSHKRDV